MAQNTVYTWPVINKQAVCKTQDANAGDDLILDGTMSVIGASQISFLRTGVSRSVSISSVDDLSGVMFTVTGIQNGAGIIKNNITGPAANQTVYTDEIFDTITSVSVDANVTNVQVGTGTTGFLPLIGADPNFSRFNIRNTNGSYALSVIPMTGNVPAENGITYTLWTTLENVENNYIPLLSQINRFFSLSVADYYFADQLTKNLYQASKLTNYILVQITATAQPETNSLEVIFMQS